MLNQNSGPWQERWLKGQSVEPLSKVSAAHSLAPLKHLPVSVTADTLVQYVTRSSVTLFEQQAHLEVSLMMIETMGFDAFSLVRLDPLTKDERIFVLAVSPGNTDVWMIDVASKQTFKGFIINFMNSQSEARKQDDERDFGRELVEMLSSMARSL